MAYKLNKADRIQEELELETGQIIKTNVVIADILTEYTINFNKMIKLEQKIKTLKPENAESIYNEMGEVFLNLMLIILAKKILKLFLNIITIII